MEIAAILGRHKMEKVATLHCKLPSSSPFNPYHPTHKHLYSLGFRSTGRTFATNVPDAQKDQVSWRTFVEKLNPDLRKASPPNPNFYPYTLPSYKAKIVLQAEVENSLGKMECDDDGGAQGKGKGKFKAPEALDEGETAPPPPTTAAPLSSPLSSPPSSPRPLTQSKHHRSSPVPVKTEEETALPPLLDPSTAERMYQKDIDDALDLLEKLLHPESVKRITPRDALYHPFLAEKGVRVPLFGGSKRDHAQDSTSSSETVVDPASSTTAVEASSMDTVSQTDSKSEPTLNPKPKKKGDDAFVPHPFGEGVCKEYHFIDEVTGQPGVIVRQPKCLCGCAGNDGTCSDGGDGRRCDGAGEVEHVRKLVAAGEGIAIGERACEFHRGYKEGW